MTPAASRRAPTPFMKAPLSRPSHPPPKGPLPSTIAVGVRLLTYEFGSNTNIQSVAFYPWLPKSHVLLTCQQLKSLIPESCLNII